MKILYHHRTQAEDAQGIHIYEMVKAFKYLGHDVVVASLVSIDEKTGNKNKGGKLRYIKKKTPNFLYELIEIFYNVVGYNILCKKIKIEAPDFIYERYSLNTFCGIWASRRYNIPIILEVNSPLFKEQMDLGKLKLKSFAKFSEKWICSNSSMTITVTKQLKNILINQGVNSNKIIVMYNGVDPYKINPWVNGENIRRNYNIQKKIVVGFVGWFREWHGIELILKSFKNLIDSNQGITLLLVGDGPAYKQLYRYAVEHGLLNTVIFTGSIPHNEIPNYIAAMDIAVQPKATDYACPMKIIEYMGMGKCILSIDQPNIRELIDNGYNGILFADYYSLLKKLSELIEHKEKRERLGKNAYKSLQKRKLFWNTNAEKVIALMSNIAGSA